MENRKIFIVILLLIIVLLLSLSYLQKRNMEKIVLNGQTRAGEGSSWEMELDSNGNFKAQISGSAGSTKIITTRFKDKIDKKTTQKVFSEIKNLIKNQTSVNQTRKETIRTQTYTLYFEEAVIINDKQPLFNEIDSIVNQINQESKKAAEFFEKI